MSDRVTFTPDSADRIAKVVRLVEAGNRNTGALPTAPRFGGGGGGKVFRVCKFTGSWSINTSKTVTFVNQTNTPNTASAINLFFPIATGPTAAADCAIAKDGTAWYLIDVPLQTATAVFVTGTATQEVLVNATTATAVFVTGTDSTSVVSDISLSATLNTSDCTISVSKTLATSAITIVSGTQTQTFVVSAETATAAIITQTSSATYLTLDW